LFRTAKDTIPRDLFHIADVVGIIRGKNVIIEKNRTGKIGKTPLTDLNVADGSRLVIMQPVVDRRFEDISAEENNEP
jgi:hypothetical protein